MKYFKKIKVTHEFIRNTNLSDVELYVKALMEQQIQNDMETQHLMGPLDFKKIDTLNIPYDYGWLDMNYPNDRLYFDDLQKQGINEYMIIGEFISMDTLC